jgi:hypothetical protein
MQRCGIEKRGFRPSLKEYFAVIKRARSAKVWHYLSSLLKEEIVACKRESPHGYEARDANHGLLFYQINEFLILQTGRPVSGFLQRERSTHAIGRAT